MPKVGDLGTSPIIEEIDGSSGDPSSLQSEVTSGSRRSSRYGVHGSSDLLLAHRLQQEEYWAMNKRKPKAKKPSNHSAGSSQPLKRGFDISTSGAISGFCAAQSSPCISAAETLPHKKAYVLGPAGQRSAVTRPSGETSGDQVSSTENVAECDLNHNKELDRVALLLLALQECCDDIPLPQVPDKLEDSVIVICPSTGPSSAQLSFRLSPFDCQCNLANQVSLHQFKAPVASSMIDLCSIVKEQLGPCAATGDVQFFVRGLLLSKFATLRDAHTLWTVV